MAQLLTAQQIAKAALKAYDEGKLGFQNGATECLYSYQDKPGVGCAVGVALTDKSRELALAYNDMDVTNLHDNGIIHIAANGINSVEKLQCFHDRAVMHRGEEGTVDAFLEYARELAA